MAIGLLSKSWPAAALGEPAASILALVLRQSGCDFSAYRPASIQRGIERRMRLQNLDDPHRYLLLLHRRGLGEEPDALLVEDVPLLVTVAAWATTCAIVLALN